MDGGRNIEKELVGDHNQLKVDCLRILQDTADDFRFAIVKDSGYVWDGCMAGASNVDAVHLLTEDETRQVFTWLKKKLGE